MVDPTPTRADLAEDIREQLGFDDGVRDQRRENLRYDELKTIRRELNKITQTSNDHLSDGERRVLAEIQQGDANSLNGGHYVSTEDREAAERLVSAGKVVRMKSPGGASPKYVPMDSGHYGDDRLERMSERQRQEKASTL